MTDIGDGPVSTCTCRQPSEGKRYHGYLWQNTVCCTETRLVQWGETKRRGGKGTLIFSYHHLWPYLLQTFNIVRPWHHSVISSLWCVLHNTADMHSCYFPDTCLYVFGLALPHPSLLGSMTQAWGSMGGGIAQWLEHRTHDWKVTGSNPCRSGGRIFFSRVNFLCWLLFRCPFHPCVTAVARKRSRSFCQKCRWQVTAIHTYTLRMWLCMKWHGAWLYGVHRICAEMAAVSCGTSRVSAVSTPLRWIFKNVL